MQLVQFISDLLSIITISLCLVLKFPQIISLYQLKSAAGINIYGLLLELSSYTTTACYNYVNSYALLSYMEYPIIIVQEFMLIFLVLKYKSLFNRKTYGLCVFYFTIAFGFLSHIIPPSVLTFLIPFCTPVSLSSKAIQLWEILSTKNADSVSITTWLISAFTNFTRSITLCINDGSKILLLNAVLSAILSSTVSVAAAVVKKTKYHRNIKQVQTRKLV